MLDDGVIEEDVQEEEEAEDQERTEEPTIEVDDNPEGNSTIEGLEDLRLEDLEASLRFNERVFGDLAIDLENEQFYRHRHPLIHEFSAKERLTDGEVQ